jgi:hypothetical protein
MGVTGYEVFRNGVKIATLGPSSLNFHDAALATATYTYRVDAFDASANHSALSAPVVAVVANDPPAATHMLVAHPSRDQITASGYPAASGPYTFQVLRGDLVFTSLNVAADAGGNVSVNGAGGGCWNGTTPDLRAGDVIRITNAAGIAEQTTLADLTTQFAVGMGNSTAVVHGTSRDAAGQPLPLAQLELRLVAAAGVFAKNASPTLRATAGAGGDGTLAYDAPGSTHWTATFSGLTPDDVARATGGVTTTGSIVAAAESRAMWLGRSPAASTEESVLETGPAVAGGPLEGECAVLALVRLHQRHPAGREQRADGGGAQQRQRADDDRRHLHRRPERQRVRDRAHEQPVGAGPRRVVQRRREVHAHRPGRSPCRTVRVERCREHAGREHLHRRHRHHRRHAAHRAGGRRVEPGS